MGTADDSGLVAIGTVLAGRYRIAGVLGSGGMGRVYRGEHTAIGKPVAVKVLRTALGHNREAATRFQREAIASGRLDHPNIVSVIDFGSLDDGKLYLVMEALDGEHLGQRLAFEERIAWTDALLIIRGVLLGLRHAHDRGVVHRDIKPDNIFLANKNGETVVKVLDFGIAKLYAGNTDDQTATRTGITVGTPSYLSPEQATGGAITPASDIYSASVVLYEMLAGRAPFVSDDPFTLLTAHVGCEPPLFAEAAPDLKLPDALEQLVRRGLAKIIAERIGSAEYIEAIDEILLTRGISVAPAPRTPRASQSIGIPLGPYNTPTPWPAHLAGTPAPLALTPSPYFLETLTPTPSPAVRTPTPAPSISKPSKPQSAPATASIPPRRKRAHRTIAIAAVVVVAAATLVFGLFRMHHGDTQAASPVSASVSAPPTPTPQDDKQAQLQSALHDLEDGATCADRKKAIAKLVDLGDPKAVPAIKKARAGGKPNACLRAAAGDALKALASRI